MRRREDHGGEGRGRVEPVAAEGGVDLPAPDPVDGEPVDVLRGRVGRQRAQHRAPAADRGDGAPLQRPAGAVEPLPGGGIEARRLLVEDPPGRRRQLPKRRVQPCQRHLEALGRLQQARHRRADRGLEAVARIAVRTAGVHLLANEREEGFARAGAACRRRAGCASRVRGGRRRRRRFRQGQRRRRGRRRRDRRAARASPAARDLRPSSAPRSQRRSSAVSSPDSASEKAASAASNRWWPSSKT